MSRPTPRQIDQVIAHLRLSSEINAGTAEKFSGIQVLAADNRAAKRKVKALDAVADWLEEMK